MFKTHNLKSNTLTAAKKAETPILFIVNLTLHTSMNRSTRTHAINLPLLLIKDKTTQISLILIQSKLKTNI